MSNWLIHSAPTESDLSRKLRHKLVIVHNRVMAKVQVVVSNIQPSLRRLAEISVNTLTCVRDQVQHVPGSGLGDGEQLYSPFHRIDLDVLFDTETSFEFHHGFINSRPGVYTSRKRLQYLACAHCLVDCSSIAGCVGSAYTTLFG